MRSQKEEEREEKGKKWPTDAKKKPTTRINMEMKPMKYGYFLQKLGDKRVKKDELEHNAFLCCL